MEPRISIITPSLNSSRYIEQAIQSVLAQNYPNFEHIIMDGGSTDGTIAILKKYPHLIWKSEPDSGQSHAMNKGFALSSGEIIVYLNADDFFEPDAFLQAIGNLDRKKGIFILAGKCHLVDEEGKKMPASIKPGRQMRVDLCGMLQWWRFSFPTNSSSYFYFRDVQEKVGAFDPRNHYSMDYDFLLRCSLLYPIKKIDVTFGNFRYIPGTKTFLAEHSGHWWKNLEFSKHYWRYLPPLEFLGIWLSYSAWISQQVLKALARKIIPKQLLRVRLTR